MESYQELQRQSTTGASLTKPAFGPRASPSSPHPQPPAAKKNLLNVPLLKMEPLKSIQEFLDTQAKATQKQRGQVPAKLLAGLEVLPVSLTALRRAYKLG